MPTKEKVKQAILDLYQKERIEWLMKARHLAHRIALTRGEVCADDIWANLQVPKGIDPRIMGSVFDGMKVVRYQRSARKECHHRPITVFTIGHNNEPTQTTGELFPQSAEAR
jgi:hypothetical protein